MTHIDYENDDSYLDQPRQIPKRTSVGASRKRPDVFKKRPAVRHGIKKRRVRRIKW